jgi:lipopolysaccharide/colanic/teichoic acid biosynthesis glycosyltransferase
VDEFALGEMPVLNFTDVAIPAEDVKAERLSAWVLSSSKRLFDIALVVASLPLLLPLLASIAIAIFVSDATPILFRQVRVGRNGRRFIIYKFRTMERAQSLDEQTIASMSQEKITRIGRTLRRFKLDELPQVLNVLKGDMSLVGPRPKIPEQQLVTFSCRPGITGPATLAFACEETLFARIPTHLLADYYRIAVLPLKLRLDADYMAQASLLSDLAVLFKTVTGRWEESASGPKSTGCELPLQQNVYGLNSSEQ